MILFVYLCKLCVFILFKIKVNKTKANLMHLTNRSLFCVHACLCLHVVWWWGCFWGQLLSLTGRQADPPLGLSSWTIFLDSLNLSFILCKTEVITPFFHRVTARVKITELLENPGQKLMALMVLHIFTMILPRKQMRITKQKSSRSVVSDSLGPHGL